MNNPNHHALLGCLLGTALGDALGLPAERLSRTRVAAMRMGTDHRFVLGRGMFSDDTEHTLMLAAALIKHGEDAAALQRSFAWKLRWWLLALPAGVGLSTAKSILRLWMGFPVATAGVQSAGNGAAMRSAIVGVVFCDDAARRHEFALAACRVTHRGPRAEESALLVAEAAALAVRRTPARQILATLEPLIQSKEMRIRFGALKASLGQGVSVACYAERIGCGHGVSGFAPNSVAVALYAWLRHRGDFAQAIREVIACGGDTDTVAAITGGICGAEVGESGIPQPWITGIWEWPRSVSYIRRVADALASGEQHAPRLFWPAIPFRNLLFLLIVLLHGFRRLLPPY
ncbi:MAG TPA: ADP-ribosylglycohydrolase family protein [Prosthecobacter sp.]